MYGLLFGEDTIVTKKGEWNDGTGRAKLLLAIHGHTHTHTKSIIFNS
jgi:hypothetical protein